MSAHSRPRFSCAKGEPWVEYLGGILDKLGCSPLRVGGTADHVHILFSLSRTRTIADAVEETKKGALKWM